MKYSQLRAMVAERDRQVRSLTVDLEELRRVNLETFNRAPIGVVLQCDLRVARRDLLSTRSPELMNEAADREAAHQFVAALVSARILRVVEEKDDPRSFGGLRIRTYRMGIFKP